MKQILILYYSGVGNTRKVADQIAGWLGKKHKVSMYSVEDLPKQLKLETFDAAVIGFPTIHAAPAEPIMAFMERQKRLRRKLPVWLYTTCGWYSANTLRIFAHKSIAKNIIPVQSRSYRCLAVDGLLIAPALRMLFLDDRHLAVKVRQDSARFAQLLRGELRAEMPRFKLYGIINYPNKLAGQNITFCIYLHREACVRCGKCVRNCPSGALVRDNKGYPVINRAKCINCYRCIHHCPERALSLSKHRRPERTFTDYHQTDEKRRRTLPSDSE